MSHEITGKDTGIYNTPAWHGLLRVAGDYFTREVALSPEGGNLGWRVGTIPMRHGDLIIPGWNWSIREDLPENDPDRYLAPVGTRFVPIQNADAADMAEAIAEAGGACFASAFSMRGGRRVVFLLKLPHKIDILDDTVETYLMICNAHDGTKVLEAVLTTVRVVCWNTYTLAINQATNVWRIRHNAHATNRIEEAKRVLGLIPAYNDEYKAVAVDLAQKQVNEAFVKAYIEALFPINPNAKKATRVNNVRNMVRNLFDGKQKGADMVACKGTRWGLLNAVSEYVDHSRTVRKTEGRSQEEARADSLLFGTGAALKQSAYNLMINADDLLADALVRN